AAEAQDVVIDGAREKSVRIVHTDEPPVIDGRLDDPAWATAARFEDLHEVQPTEYAAPSERTVIYLTYTDEALYVGAMLYDSNAEEITDRILRQGEQVFGDDWFSVMIDPFHDRRSGYRFLTNPNGIRQEGLYQNVSDTQWDWQGIWRTGAGKTDEGWITEIEIPFKSISFDPQNDTWGINFRRALARRDERMAWVSRNRNTDPSTSGIAVGFEGLHQGMGLDVVPSASVTGTRTVANPVTNEPDVTVSDSAFEPSLDVFYKLSPSLTGALTLNTDFSATEVDDRQVNLTRFGLFFPEKRDFFLQDADIFEFGNINENGRPFFSRRIGLSGEGNPVDLEIGGKISGRVGRFNLGALAIRQDGFVDAGADIGADNAIVARASANLLRESNIGFIATEGDPRSDTDNSVAGIDFLYRNSRLPGGRLFETNAWLQKSETPGLEEDDEAYGFRVASPNNRGFRGAARYTYIEENFNPALGFVNRAGIRELNYGVQYTARPREGYLRSILGGVNAEQIKSIATGRIESEQFRLRMAELEGRDGDELQLRRHFNREVLTNVFEISEGVVIPEGDYEFDDLRIELSTADHRRVWGELEIRSGDFFNGTRDEIGIEASWRPSGRLFTSLSYEYNEIEVIDVAGERRRFETRLAAFRTEVAFSSTLSWVTLMQYDNVSETIGINSRIHWIPQAGREAFLVLNHNVQDLDRDNRFHTSFSEAAVKFSYTLRF
ncbi:MAG TPA: DUF5916 domain-containing protein, partial [Gammaproteobacteria bacterium]|nr:DUF5916 domain-containing protein [Gammaproteobacteria bacterium]